MKVSHEVCVAGLGTIGLPTAVYMMNHGVSVRGYDISESAVERARAAGIQASTSPILLASGTVIVCVNTSMNSARPDVGPVEEVVKRVSGYVTHENRLVSIESTVPPGTSRELYRRLLGPKFRLVHVPSRYWGGDPEKHGVRQPRVIGGIDKPSLDAGVELYQECLGIPLHTATSLEVAEASKVLENSYRYVQIAFAEEARAMLEGNGMDFAEVRSLCNTKWNIAIPEARNGIGGGCLPKDIRYLAALRGPHPLIDGAMKADEGYSMNHRESGEGNRRVLKGARTLPARRGVKTPTG